MATQKTTETATACQKSGKWDQMRKFAMEFENGSTKRLCCSDVRALLNERDQLLDALVDVMSDPYFGKAKTRYTHARAAIEKAKGGK